jgi:hypothetical protein
MGPALWPRLWTSWPTCPTASVTSPSTGLPTVWAAWLGLDMGLDRLEARATVRSGLRAGARRPRSAPGPQHQPPRRPRLRRTLQAIDTLRPLVYDASWPFEWETAKLLASLPILAGRQEVVRNWHYLTNRVDVPRLLRTVEAIQKCAHNRYPGNPECIRRLLDSIDRSDS